MISGDFLTELNSWAENRLVGDDKKSGRKIEAIMLLQITNTVHSKLYRMKCLITGYNISSQVLWADSFMRTDCRVANVKRLFPYGVIVTLSQRNYPAASSESVSVTLEGNNNRCSNKE